ncbi:MAG TPA: hypothetical protein V6C72_17525 [Chroococcales cyanobacterium]
MDQNSLRAEILKLLYRTRHSEPWGGAAGREIVQSLEQDALRVQDSLKWLREHAFIIADRHVFTITVAGMDQLAFWSPEFLPDQIKFWRKNARLAWEAGNREVCQIALDRGWRFQKILDEREGREPPAGPPDIDDYFGPSQGRKPGDGPPGFWPPGRNPDNFGPVPKEPYPSTGGNENALPEPPTEPGFLP